MRIGLYTPYLNSFGGGERYVLTAAEVFLKAGCKTELVIDRHLATLSPQSLVDISAKRFKLDLGGLELVKGPFGHWGDFLKRPIFLKRYDLFFYLTDGSIFYTTAKKNVLHFQVPFECPPQTLWGRIKLSSWTHIIYNSIFTQNIIEKNWGISGRVVYPPVDTESIQPLKKNNNILSVGRFTSFLRSKKHKEMIGAFVNICKKGIAGWSLHLAGSVEGDAKYIDELKSLAKGFPVFFYPNADFKVLTQLYGNAKIYWHAAGLSETDPKKMEHFGITTVEAMAGGCVPVVINKGGQVEIIENYKSGLLWENLNELENLTVKLMRDEKLLNKLSRNAILASEHFSKGHFEREMKKIVGF